MVLTVLILREWEARYPDSISLDFLYAFSVSRMVMVLPVESRSFVLSMRSYLENSSALKPPCLGGVHGSFEASGIWTSEDVMLSWDAFSSN